MHSLYYYYYFFPFSCNIYQLFSEGLRGNRFFIRLHFFSWIRSYFYSLAMFIRPHFI